MRAFADLFARLDATNKTNVKLAALVDYFAHAAPADGAWAIFFLCGRKLKRLLKSAQLRDWGAEAAEIPAWMFDECYHAVGDLAETLALLVPGGGVGIDVPLHAWVEESLRGLFGRDESEQKQIVLDAWKRMDAPQRLVWNKLITGSFRVGVSQGLVVRALAESARLDAAIVAHRLMGDWQPSDAFFRQLVDPETSTADATRPYPFFLAHPLEDPPESLGDIHDWQVEWKWDGIRAQLIRRPGALALWSRGEEILTERFPEIMKDAARLPMGTVLDGEVLAWKDDVLPFAELQKRIGRKNVSRRMQERVPVAFLAFDLLEADGVDLRTAPLHERRTRLEAMFASASTRSLRLSSLVEAASWAELGERRLQSRERNVEGVMLKRRDSAYGVGRVTGDWWKWKIHPYSIDAVLIYAQLGHGKRASLYTDFTFAVWHEGELAPFAKAYSGLTDEEIRAVDRFVRQNTTEKFGPVRQVRPELVFEIAFEGIQASTRHKSGVAVRFPRIARWRHDKKPADADTLESLRRWIKPTPAPKTETSIELWSHLE